MKNSRSIIMLVVCLSWQMPVLVAQNEFRYSTVDEIRDSKISCERNYDFIVYNMEETRPLLQFVKGCQIAGIAMTSYTSELQSCSCRLPVSAYNELLKEVRTLPLSNLNVLATNQKQSVRGWTELDGTNYKIRVTLSDPTRKKLHDIIMNFMKRFVPKSEWKNESRIFKSDLLSARDVPLADLVTHPDQFDCQRVRVRGFKHVEFEQSSLSSGPEFVDDDKKSLWLGGASTFANPLNISAIYSNDVYVQVEGTIDARHHGHMNLWPAAIVRITEIKIIEGKHP